MENAKAKTINLLLEDGSLSGVISMQDTSWNSGELYSAPRESVDLLLKSDACSKFGVYLLLSEDLVYVGQSSDLAQRIKQHLLKKDWWERVVILTKTDNSLNKAHIDYLEYVLIDKAAVGNKLDCDNRKRGNKPNVSKFDRVMLDQYLDEALFLMELIGISVFSSNSKPKKKTKKALIPSIPNVDQEQKEIRSKKEAAAFLKEMGIDIASNSNYAAVQDKGNYFWINPMPTVLEKDWSVVLNNKKTSEIIVLFIKKGSVSLNATGKPGLKIRADNGKINLKIDASTLHDKSSGLDLSSYVVKRISY